MTLSTTQEKVSKRERPETYADASIIVFYAVMTLKRITALAEANRLLGADPLYTATQVATWQTARKTAIEPFFDLMNVRWRLSTRNVTHIKTVFR